MVNRLMSLVFLLSVLWLGGCASDSSLQYYMLSADDEQTEKLQVVPINRSLVVGLGPIHLPEYLDRPQIVVETGKNQYRLDEHHRWAERLDQNMGRALAQFLNSQSGIEQVVRFPWAQKQAMDYQVSIDVLQLHQSADGVSRLQAQWQIKNQDRQSFGRRFDCSIPANNDADAIVKAQSLCLGRLGTEITTRLRQLAGEGNRE